jgi:hypothetical protein
MNDWWGRMTLSRRGPLGAGGVALAAGAVGRARGQQTETVEHAPVSTVPASTAAQHHGGHGGMLTVGEDGRRLREFDILAEDKEASDCRERTG